MKTRTESNRTLLVAGAFGHLAPVVDVATQDSNE